MTTNSSIVIHLPESRRGRRTPEDQASYDAQLQRVWAAMLGIKSRLEFTPSARGWCYIAEEYGLEKGDFDRFERLINDARKSNDLPPDITAEDETRQTIGLQDLDDMSPEEYADWCLDVALLRAKQFLPTSFWDAQDCYVEMVVEKIDLKSLFGPVCEEFYVPLTNMKGWSDIHLRHNMLQRMKPHHQKGRRCVVLVCGDLDPGGVQISNHFRKNLLDVEQMAGWLATEANLEIVRFGLNKEFVTRHRLTWIDNLITGSGNDLGDDDPDNKEHWKPYVQDYSREHGKRKVEANALIVRPEAGQQLCRSAIMEYVDPASVAVYHAQLERARTEAWQHLPAALRRTARRLARR